MNRTSQKLGCPPGSLIHVGNKISEDVQISYIHYNKDYIIEKSAADIEECLEHIKENTITWINVSGIHNTKIIEKIGHELGINSLTLEDILHTRQRPKIEEYDNYIYIVLKKIYLVNEEINYEQLSLILGQNYVISFQESETGTLNPIKKRLHNNKSKIRVSTTDYLTYSLIDTVIDNYFIFLELIEDRIDNIEDELISNPTHNVLKEIHDLKREMTLLLKSVWPLRDVISTMLRTESMLIHDSTKIYFHDLYDHTIQVIDTIQTFKEIVASMLDVYLSSISNKMNEIMKVLTIIATIFIPLTFIAGIYGMNFEYMPELGWKYGYPLVLSIMLLTILGMLSYFKIKKWI
ncbi:magnesium and cobalt transport protein CorA [Methanosalsum natronophilum]|uniref:Magnesium transport protein CorA n=1 Tax=Methanosalsum natronophilum TaxID=768733 RepID=A0A3R7VTJ7_9EURY|nr:MAG: magnesium and cobalt transport protein CorA [Methanosalsum natronophilum]